MPIQLRELSLSPSSAAAKTATSTTLILSIGATLEAGTPAEFTLYEPSPGVFYLVSPLDTANMTEVEITEEQESLLGWLNRWCMTSATEIEERALHFGEKHLAQSGWTPGVHARRG